MESSSSHHAELVRRGRGKGLSVSPLVSSAAALTLRHRVSQGKPRASFFHIRVGVPLRCHRPSRQTVRVGEGVDGESLNGEQGEDVNESEGGDELEDGELLPTILGL